MTTSRKPKRLMGKRPFRLRHVYGKCQTKLSVEKKHAMLKAWAVKRNNLRKGLNSKHIVRMCGRARAYFDANNLNSAVRLWSVRMSERAKNVGMNHDDTLTCMGYLASVYDYFEEWEDALQWRKKIVKIRRKSRGEQHYLTLNSMRHLKQAYLNCGRDDLAEKTMRQLREIAEEIERKIKLRNLRQTAREFTNLGRFDDAKALVTEMKKEQNSTLKPKHSRILEFTAELATIYREEGKLSVAEQLGSSVASLLTTMLGRSHRSTISCEASLASTYERQGRHDKAEELRLRVVDTARENLGEEDEDTLDYMDDLISLYMHLEHYDKAERWEIRVLRARTNILGEKHPETLLSMSSLATINAKQHRYQEAKDLCLRLRKSAVEMLGSNHPDTVNYSANLASLYAITGQYETAESLERAIIIQRREVLGETHPDTIESIDSLAFVYTSQGRYGDAEPLQREVLEKQMDSLGKNHSDTLSTTIDVAITCYQQGKLNEAMNMVNDVLRRIKTADAKHLEVLTRVGNLVVALLRSRDLYSAKRLGKQVVEARKRVLGVCHNDTVISMANLAMAYVLSGQFEEAEGVMAGVISQRSQMAGNDGLSTLATSFTLGIVQLKSSWYVARGILTRVARSSREVLGDAHPLTTDCIRNLKDLEDFVERLPKTCHGQKRKRKRGW